MDFAKRAKDALLYDIDPIVRSLLDIDFYKLLMQQLIREDFFNTKVTFAVTNRTKRVKLARNINIKQLRAQLDHARTLRFQPNEIHWLKGNTFYGQDRLFKPGYIEYLKTFQLPEYSLEVDEETGQYILEFHGTWTEVTLWEIYALTIINELLARSRMSKLTATQIDIMYARAKAKLYAKLEKLATVEDLNLTDFATRRRHSFLWQEYAMLLAKEVLGDRFTGTSNAYLAMKHGLEAKGTNAHELPMTLAALAQDDAELKDAQYKVLLKWAAQYRGGLLVFLPDTFGTTQFLENAPQWVSQWTGARPDSKKPIPGGDELIKYWKTHGENPQEKLIIFSDGLDVKIDGYDTHGEDILEIEAYFRGKVRMGFGWGTNLSNDFYGCVPGEADDYMGSISVVAKIKDADGRPAVKMSDNYNKATGPASEVDRYRALFGIEGLDGAPVLV
jgi:nicotinate phosphoribosyltransferase